MIWIIIGSDWRPETKQGKLLGSDHAYITSGLLLVFAAILSDSSLNLNLNHLLLKHRVI